MSGEAAYAAAVAALSDDLEEEVMRVALLRETLTAARDELAAPGDYDLRAGLLARIDETLNATREGA